jgi:prefoldin subunit 5
MEKKVVKRELYLAGYFVAFCSPRTKEFILPLFSNYPIDTTDNDTLEILSSDKDFIESLREVKESIDTAYRRIISYPDFVF